MLYIYAAGLLIPCIRQCFCPALFLNKVMNLLNSVVNVVHLHKVIWLSVSFAVLQIVSHVKMLCCVYHVQC